MPYRVGVISDTHIPRRAKFIPPIVIQKFAGADLIIHAGDLTDLQVIEELKKIALVEAVCGNVDSVPVIEGLSRKKVISIGKVLIGIVHGDGDSGTTVQRAAKAFINKKLDCIVFGHSHIPFVEKINGILMFNPGSPTDHRRQPHPSFGVLTVNNGSINAELFYFDEASSAIWKNKQCFLENACHSKN